MRYIADFIGKEIFGVPFEITTNPDDFINYNGPGINYSGNRLSGKEFFLSPHPLLFEKKIQLQATACFEVNGKKAFFNTSGDFPFDIFAASFYLLSRYEEYLSFKQDIYGRYAHENSLAFKENFLGIPLINYWLEDFKTALRQKFPETEIQSSHGNGKTFTFMPTYDIDIAYSYLHKGFRRITGGILKSILKGDWSKVHERWKVLTGKAADPFDVYAWMDRLHEQYGLKPHYFFHVGIQKGKYDKNISPAERGMVELIRRQSGNYPIGIHPSWESGDKPDLLEKEIQTLQTITGEKISASRQHYIRFSLPETFRRLIDTGIRFDYSMGYGSINGFRASVASHFFWYDLEKDEQTPLQLFPFCYMDANSFYEQKFSAQQALGELRHYYNAVKSVNGLLVTIWHNNFLGTDKLFAGWKEIYEQFITEIHLSQLSKD